MSLIEVVEVEVSRQRKLKRLSLIWEMVGSSSILFRSVKLHRCGPFDLNGIHLIDSSLFFRCALIPKRR